MKTSVYVSAKTQQLHSSSLLRAWLDEVAYPALGRDVDLR